MGDFWTDDGQISVYLGRAAQETLLAPKPPKNAHPNPLLITKDYIAGVAFIWVHTYLHTLEKVFQKRLVPHAKFLDAVGGNFLRL